MATGMYDKGREGFAQALIDWDDDDIKCVLADAADYTVNLATHDFYDDVTAAGRVAVSGNLAGKSSTNGVCDASDLVVSTVSGDEFEALILFKDTTVEGTSRLICYIDNYTGLPFTPNGGNITIAWPNDANRIFKL